MPWTNDENKADIYYEVEGSGPPIVFIHPPGMGHVTFRGQKDGLKSLFTVITPDLRGNGKSGTDDRELTMHVVAEDVVRVLDDCGIDKAYVCGYSNGGSVVLEMAINFPDRVRGMIIIGGFPEVNSFILRNEFKLGIWATSQKLMGLVSNVLAFAHEKRQENRKELQEYIKYVSPEFLEEYYRLGLAYNVTDRLKEITCPVLLIYGQRDDYVHHYKDLFDKYITGDVSMILVGNVAHQIPTKKVNALNQILKQFVAKTEQLPSFS
ncbi:pimeloyl-ACP methyl ester carboxylesterase [Evansella vedderi]|uniref:Pimeloyl-ACP methyl ester carboxylesterase n=1 Tax=Evansella vedderi TaxID=38282 RepID=A0ABU0A1M3_9BACI|nr:alpha/beta hydrolase [Evansella vedderi]MDQ0257391.1 pimeloyl-ACP methyl ester carboxylesterase [Evansella vedderi]